jgi:hypothetical protein
MMAQNFSCRSHQPEMMDRDAIGFEDFRKCLRDLEMVNVCTLAYRPTLHWLKRALRGDKSRQPVFILDIGSGGGGMLRKIWRWARDLSHGRRCQSLVKKIGRKCHAASRTDSV